MNENAPTRNIPLMVIHFIFTACALALSILTLTTQQTDPLTGAKIGVTIAALICGFIYFCYGYKKHAAVFYKLFIVLYAVVTILELVIAFGLLKSGDAGYAPIVCEILVFIILVFLAFAKDLGKVKSYFLCIILLAAQFVCLLVNYINATEIQQFANVILAVTVAIMLIAKYFDKARRNH